MTGRRRSAIVEARAVPPTGNLRWRPPAPPASWGGVRDATQFGPSCPQQTVKNPYLPPGPISEDCLYLNVYTPTSRSGSGGGRPAAGEKFATAVGCADQTAQCLRSVPVSDLVNSFGVEIPGVVDGSVLPQSIGTAIAHGQFARVPILNGITHDEEMIFVDALGIAVSGGTDVPIPGTGQSSRTCSTSRTRRTRPPSPPSRCWPPACGRRGRTSPRAATRRRAHCPGPRSPTGRR